MPRLFKPVLLFAVGAGLPAGAFAQNVGPIPINPQTIDFVTSISQSIDQLVTQHTDLFISDATTLLNVIAAFQLIRLAIRWMWHPYAMWHAHVDLGELIVFMGKLAGCLIVLHYYNRPLPGASFSFHQVFTYAARMISGTIDLSILKDFANNVNAIASNLEKPAAVEVIESFFTTVCWAIWRWWKPSCSPSAHLALSRPEWARCLGRYSCRFS